MKLAAGILLFLLCGLAGEQKSRRLSRRAGTLAALETLIRQIGDRQLNELVSFEEGVRSCPPSPERDYLLSLVRGQAAGPALLAPEEEERLRTYARRDSRDTADLSQARDSLLDLFSKAAKDARREQRQKGQVYRSVGYLAGMAVLLLVL